MKSSPEELETLAGSLRPTDRVALEETGSAWEIVRICKPHVAEVVVVSPGDTGIAQAQAKIDRLDAPRWRSFCRRASSKVYGGRMITRGCWVGGWCSASS